MKFDNKTKELIVNVFEELFSQDDKALESSIVRFANNIKKTDPFFHREIIGLLYAKNIGGSAIRGKGSDPLPIDLDSKLETAQIVNVNQDFSRPIFDSTLDSKIDDFLDQQENVEKLAENNLFPPSKVLLIGPPGSGKTMLAKYIASKLNRQLVVLDLATVVSSFLGKTGLNIKKVLDYAKRNKVILLLDEFDAIAKRRDDLSDLGELKRVVNILLVELDNWPSSSMLIATSNHPELLDRAIWRRFDDVIEIDAPTEDLIKKLLKTNLPDVKKKVVEIVAPFLVGRSASDICSYANKVKRRIVLKETTQISSAFFELGSFVDKNLKGKLCIKAKEILGEGLTVRDLAQIIGLSPSGVQYHLTKEK